MFDPWIGKVPWRRKWQPTQVFLSGKPHGQEEPGGLQSTGLQKSRPSNPDDRMQFSRVTKQKWKGRGSVWKATEHDRMGHPEIHKQPGVGGAG